MTQRQRRRQGQRRRDARRPRIAAGAGIALGATLVAPAVSHATDFTVTNVADSNVSGSGTLRRAILDANAHSGADRVLFASGVSGTIHLSSTLGSLTIADPLEILGPGADQLAVHGDGSH